MARSLARSFQKRAVMVLTNSTGTRFEDGVETGAWTPRLRLTSRDGQKELKARDAGQEVVVGKFPFAALGRAQTYGNTDGLMKIVADKKYGEILGVHVIGPSASDLIPEGVLAIQLEATLEDIANTIHAHPTLGEGSMEAAMVALGLPVHVR